MCEELQKIPYAKNRMIHRQPSESGASGFSHGSSGSSSAPKKWRLPILRKMPSIRMREDKGWPTV